MNVKNLLTPPIDASHGFIRILTGLSKKVYPRLREFLSQIEAEVVSDNRNKIHQTTFQPIPEQYLVIKSK